MFVVNKRCAAIPGTEVLAEEGAVNVGQGLFGPTNPKLPRWGARRWTRRIQRKESGSKVECKGERVESEPGMREARRRAREVLVEASKECLFAQAAVKKNWKL